MKHHNLGHVLHCWEGPDDFGFASMWLITKWDIRENKGVKINLHWSIVVWKVLCSDESVFCSILLTSRWVARLRVITFILWRNIFVLVGRLEHDNTPPFSGLSAVHWVVWWAWWMNHMFVGLHRPSEASKTHFWEEGNVKYKKIGMDFDKFKRIQSWTSSCYPFYTSQNSPVI